MFALCLLLSSRAPSCLSELQVYREEKGEREKEVEKTAVARFLSAAVLSLTLCVRVCI